jgi:hypothetical protein
VASERDVRGGKSVMWERGRGEGGVAPTVKQMGRMKKSPAIPEMGTTRLRALGTSRAGSATSSAIEVIIPIAAKV